MKFIEILPDRNQKHLKQHGLEASSNNSFVPSVIFHDAKCPFGLYRSVHPEKCPMDTFQIVDYFLMHGREFLIDPYGPVLICPFASLCIGTPSAIFTLIDLFLPSILVSFYTLYRSFSKIISLGRIFC